MIPPKSFRQKQCFLSHLIIFHSIFLMIFNFQYMKEIFQTSHVSFPYFRFLIPPLMHITSYVGFALIDSTSEFFDQRIDVYPKWTTFASVFSPLISAKAWRNIKKNSWIEKTCELLKLHPYLGKIAMLTNIAILDTTNANYSTYSHSAPLQLPRPGGRIQEHHCRFE